MSAMPHGRQQEAGGAVMDPLAADPEAPAGQVEADHVITVCPWPGHASAHRTTLSIRHCAPMFQSSGALAAWPSPRRVRWGRRGDGHRGADGHRAGRDAQRGNRRRDGHGDRDRASRRDGDHPVETETERSRSPEEQPGGAGRRGAGPLAGDVHRPRRADHAARGPRARVHLDPGGAPLGATARDYALRFGERDAGRDRRARLGVHDLRRAAARARCSWARPVGPGNACASRPPPSPAPDLAALSWLASQP